MQWSLSAPFLAVLALVGRLPASDAQTLIAGAAGWALRFDGLSSFVALIGELPQWPVTVEMWLQPLDLTDGMGQKIVTWNKYGTVFSKHSVNGGAPILSVEHNGNKIQFATAKADKIETKALDPGSNKSIGRLYHWAYTRKNATHYACYLDGVRVVSGRFPVAEGVSQRSSFPSHPWLLGGRVQHLGGKWTTDDRSYGGVIDEVRWWSTERTAAQLKAGMYLPVPATEPGLVSQWRWDEGAGMDGTTFVLGGGDISKAPQWVPSPVPGRGGPVVVVSRTGSPAQGIDLCVLLLPGSNATGTVSFLTVPTVGELEPSSSIPLMRRNSSATDPANSALFCGQTNFTPVKAGFEEVSFVASVTLPDGRVLNATQKLSMRVTNNSAPVAGHSWARRFNGASYATLGQFDFQENLTVAFWAAPLATGEGNTMLSQHLANGENIFQLQYQSQGWALTLECPTCAGDAVVFPEGEDDAVVLNTGKTARQIRASRGEAHHIMFSVSCLARGEAGAKDKVKSRVVMYLDGEAIGIKDNFKSCFPKPAVADRYSSDDDPLQLPMPWEIGEEYDTRKANQPKHIPGTEVAPSDFFSGFMDDFTFWSVELSPEEALLAAQGQRVREDDVLAHFTFDLDDPDRCEEAQLAHDHGSCGVINEEEGRPVTSKVFPWSPHIFGDVALVPSPFNRLPGTAIHATMQEETCRKVTLTGFDRDGDQLTYRLEGEVPTGMTLRGSTLEFCAGSGPQDNIAVQFDACDTLGLCSSAYAGLGTAIFHVLVRGPRIIAFQALPEQKALRLVFDTATNQPDLSDSVQVGRVFNISMTGFSTRHLLLGRWDQEGSSALLLPTNWTSIWSDGNLTTSATSTSIFVLESGRLRDAALTSYPSFGPGPSLTWVRCEAGQLLFPGEVSCRGCPPGRENRAGDCVACAQGTARAADANSSCSLCPAGKYQNGTGATHCDACAALVPGSTSDRGARSSAECSCPAGNFLRAAGTNASKVSCLPCEEGLECPGGSAPPRQRPGYWGSIVNAEVREYSVFRCRGDLECPAGPVGTCAAGRVGIACAQCLPQLYKARNGQCLPCGTQGYLAPAAAALVCAVGLLIVAFSSNLDLATQRLSTVALAAAVCQSASVLQVLSAFRRLQIEWIEPIRSLLDALDLIALDFDVIRLGCAMPSDEPVARFGLQLLAMPLCVLTLAVIRFVAARCGGRQSGQQEHLHAFANAAGFVALTFYISLTLRVLEPLRCAENPNGMQSMASDPGVVCWSGAAHRVLVALAILGILAYPVSILAAVVWATLRYPMWAVSGRGQRSLQCWRFLFRRFTMERYYFGTWYLVRNTLVAVIPVAFISTQTVQVLSMSVLLQCATCLQVKTWPWRTQVANNADMLAGLALSCFLVGGSLMVTINPSEAQAFLQYLFIVTLSMALAALPTCFALTLHKRLFVGKRYSAFLCHHKEGAGSLSRVLKMTLESISPSAVFLDSDQLRDLDLLFDTVRCDVQNLVVIRTSEVFKRMWCAGEIATAYRNKVPILVLEVDGCKLAGESDFAQLDSWWTAEQQATLATFGITMDLIKEAYQHVSGLPTLPLCRQASLAEKHGVVEDLVRCGRLPRRQFVRRVEDGVEPEVLVAGATADGEAFSALEIMAVLLQGEFQMEALVVRSGEQTRAVAQTARYLVVVLTKGVLEDRGFATALLAAWEGDGLHVVTVLADPNFAFPAPDFYQSLALEGLHGLDGERLSEAYRSVLQNIAMPFSPHGSAGLIRAQVSEVVHTFQKLPSRITLSAKGSASLKQAKQPSERGLEGGAVGCSAATASFTTVQTHAARPGAMELLPSCQSHTCASESVAADTPATSVGPPSPPADPHALEWRPEDEDGGMRPGPGMGAKFVPRPSSS